MIDSSPRATGPAGSQFEAKVGAHFALALLADTEPRGLPGAIVNRIEFQRGGQGHPLDDVIVHAVTPEGDPRCLEVQVKRLVIGEEETTYLERRADLAKELEARIKAE